jgi:hypothetical protein
MIWKIYLKIQSEKTCRGETCQYDRNYFKSYCLESFFFGSKKVNKKPTPRKPIMAIYTFFRLFTADSSRIT